MKTAGNFFAILAVATGLVIIFTLCYYWWNNPSMPFGIIEPKILEEGMLVGFIALLSFIVFWHFAGEFHQDDIKAEIEARTKT